MNKSGILFLLAMLFTSGTLLAQEGKYKVKIIKDKDGKKEVYEKSYSSKEEMAKDPNLKDAEIIHLDSASGNTFRFETDSAQTIKVIVNKHMDEDGNISITSDKVIMMKSDGDHGAYVFKTDDGDSLQGNVFFFKDGDHDVEVEQDVEIRTTDGNVMIIKRDGAAEDGNVFMWKDNEGETHDIKINKKGDNRVIVKTIGGGGTFVHKGNSARLEDATTSEINAANYTAAKAFAPKSIEYMVDASAAELSLKFEAKASPVTVELRDLTGAQVFEETIDPFNGTYNSKIDFSGQQQGTYILEIRQGQKSLHKKLVIH